MTRDDHIRRRADGSIDTTYYATLGRQARGGQAKRMLGRRVLRRELLAEPFLRS